MPNAITTPRHNDQPQAISDIQKATAHTMPAGVNVSSNTPANSPAYAPSFWEQQYGLPVITYFTAHRLAFIAMANH